MWKNSITISSFSKTSFCNPRPAFPHPLYAGVFSFRRLLFCFYPSLFFNRLLRLSAPFLFCSPFAFFVPPHSRLPSYFCSGSLLLLPVFSPSPPAFFLCTFPSQSFSSPPLYLSISFLPAFPPPHFLRPLRYSLSRTLSASFLHSPASFFPSSTHSPPSRAPAFSRFSSPAHAPYFFFRPVRYSLSRTLPAPASIPCTFFASFPLTYFPFFRLESHTPPTLLLSRRPVLSPPSDFILYYKFFLSFRSLLACLFLIVFIRNFYKIAQQRTLGCSKSQKTRTENTKPQTIHRQATFPPRQAKTSAKNKQRERKKDKNGKTKTKEEKSGKNTPAGRKADLRPYIPIQKRTARRSDGNSRIHRIRTTKTESGKATEKAKRKKSQKAKRKKRPPTERNRP